ncbi:MAG: pyridoxamine 5'-phosphate oxidase family protein [Thermacetogeniaceae bacterium]
MTKITEEIKEVAAKTKGWSLATATKDGIPNVVAIAFGKVISDNQILLMDVFMNKTRANIEANPNVAVAVWDMETLKGYQFKGTARFETSGKIFEEGTQMVKSMMPELTPKAALIVDVKEIYNLTPGPEAGKKLA